MQINGEIQNIKQYIVKRLEALYELTVPIGQLSTHELNAEMLEVTELLGREVAVYLNRQGKVLQVSVGDTDTVDLPEFKSRRAEGKLTGIRCIHTHPGGNAALSDVDIQALRLLRFDSMCAAATAWQPSAFAQTRRRRLSAHSASSPATAPRMARNSSAASARCRSARCIRST